MEYLPGEETQALKEKFIEMDTDKNGTLSYDELRAGLTKVGSVLTEFDVKQLMEAVKNSSTLEFILYTVYQLASLHSSDIVCHIYILFCRLIWMEMGLLTTLSLQPLRFKGKS